METSLQMIWQTSKRKRKANLPPLGLRNLGNTCYLNSVLQCLTFTPPLANFCLNTQHSSVCPFGISTNCPFCILERRIARSLNLETASVDSPSKIHNSLTIFSDHFRLYRQEDAHEFLRYVIDACHNTCLKINKLKGNVGNKVGVGVGSGVGNGDNSIVKEIFGGELRSQVKCLSCGGESNKMDEIMDISLDLFQISSVKDALQRFFQTEVLNGTNKYKCDNCQKLVVAKKQMSILKAPNVLVIQLKRFEGIHGGKIDRPISFDECLVLSNYMCKESQDPHPQYNLFGTIVHSGYSPESGHYYAYIKDALGRWYCCNDSIVSLTTLQEVLSEKVYILFFTRANQRSYPAKAPISTNGVKPPHGNGYDAQKPREAVPLKSMATGSNVAHNSEKVIHTTYNNGKVPSSPRIKFGNLSKELHVNGKGNGHVEIHSTSKDVKDMDRIVKERPSVTNSNGATANGSGNTANPETKQKIQSPHGNGKTLGSSNKLLEAEKREDTGLVRTLANGREADSGSISQNVDGCTISGSKRKVMDGGSSYYPSPDENLATTKEMLEKDASSYLRSCGWYDEVYAFMQAKMRTCKQKGGGTTNGIELKKLLCDGARETFTPQVPNQLKADLVARLQSFHRRRQSLDA